MAERQWLTYLQESPARDGAPGRTFDVYLARDELAVWLELEDAERPGEAITVGIMDLAHEHRPPGVLRARVGRVVFGVLVGEAELARLRRLLAQGGHRDEPLGPRTRPSPLAV